MSELHDIDRWVAALEQIARDAATGLSDIRAELRPTRTEFGQLRAEFGQLQSQVHDDFRWRLRIMLGGFVGVLGLLEHIAHLFKLKNTPRHGSTRRAMQTMLPRVQPIHPIRRKEPFLLSRARAQPVHLAQR